MHITFDVKNSHEILNLDPKVHQSKESIDKAFRNVGMVIYSEREKHLSYGKEVESEEMLKINKCRDVLYRHYGYASPKKEQNCMII